jgi:hypothetical protein
MGGTYPWCVKVGTSITDGYVETRFKPLAGREDQAGGVVWRWKNADNYTRRPRQCAGEQRLAVLRRGWQSQDHQVHRCASGSCLWHTLRVEFSGTHIAVALDGKRYIELDDSHISGPGGAGVWTKADSVTAFSRFHAGSSN